MNNSVGIIGLGFVGNAIYKSFKEKILRYQDMINSKI